MTVKLEIGVKPFVESCVGLYYTARMARSMRIEYAGAVYYVMNRGLARQATFRAPTDCEIFLQVLGEAKIIWVVEA